MQDAKQSTVWPERVARVDEILNILNVPHMISQNLPAFSCDDAASKRVRRGVLGISISQELKTVAFRHISASGAGMIYFVHCRGNSRVSVSLLKSATGKRGKFRLLSEEELDSKLGMKYGTVNPFEVYFHTRVIQLFDFNLIHDRSRSSFVMTNAGDLCWGVDFDVVRFVEGPFSGNVYKFTKN